MGFILLSAGQVWSIGVTTSGSDAEQGYQNNSENRSENPAYSALDMSKDVTAAYSAGFGGVINFDDITESGSFRTMEVSYAGGTKVLHINSGDTGNGYKISSPISGNVKSNQMLDASDNLTGDGRDNDWVIIFQSITGVVPNEKVTKVGYTFLGQEGSSRTIAEARANFDDGQFAAFTQIRFGSQDVFIGFEAPLGRHIVRLTIRMEEQLFSSIDDLAFVTETVDGNASTAGAPSNLTSFIGWASYNQFIADHALTGPDGEQDSDPDGDQTENLLEYAYFMNPTLSDSRPLSVRGSDPLAVAGIPRLSVNTKGEGEYHYMALRRVNDPFLHYLPSATPILQTSWDTHTLANLAQVERIGKDRAVVQIRNSLSNANLFFQDQVTLKMPNATTYHIDNQQDFDSHKTATFSPGDKILFKRGEIFTGMFRPSGSGTKGAPILIGNYGEGARPIINAMGAHVAGIHLHNIDYWEIHDIEITNTDGTTTDQGDLYGVYILIDTTSKTDMNHYHIRNCYIHDVNGKVAGKGRGGIHLHAYDTLDNPPFRLNDVQIVGNTISHVGGVGIGNRSDYVNLPSGNDEYLWTGVYVAHNYVNGTGRNAIIARVSKEAVYEFNVLPNSSRYSTGHSIYNFNTDGIKIQNNEVFGNIGSGSVDRGAFDADYNSRDSTFQYNYSHNNHWFIGIMCRWNKGVTIRYNISQNERKGLYFYGFHNESKLENIVVHNNVHFTKASTRRTLFNAENRRMRNTVFYNNIFYYEGRGSFGSQANDGANVVFSHNVFYHLPVWPHGEGDPDAITANPQFVNPGQGGTLIDMFVPSRLAGYRLQAGSPCVDTGIWMNGVKRDFWGNPVPTGSAIDIGVHERQP